MNGNTHIVLGIASSLAFSKPQSLSDLISSILCGAFGGWLADIDNKNKLEAEDSFDSSEQGNTNTFKTILAFFISFFLFETLEQGNILQSFKDSPPIRIGSVMAFIILSLIGYISKHRTFTHSFLGFFLFGVSVYCFHKPFAFPFLIGYASHLIIDCINKRGIQLFFPFKKRFSLNKFSSGNRIVNAVIFCLSLIASITLGSVHLMSLKDPSFFVQQHNVDILVFFIIFLPIINTITLISLSRTHRNYRKGKLSEIKYTKRINKNKLFIVIGGGLGGMLALIKPTKQNGTEWTLGCSSVFIWASILLFLSHPNQSWKLTEIELMNLKNFGIILWIFAINIICVLYMYSMKNKYSTKKNQIRHTLLLIIGAFGGTLSGLLFTIIGGHDFKYPYIKVGFTEMLIGQVIFVFSLMSIYC